MRQVDYVGHSWTAVPLEDEHLDHRRLEKSTLKSSHLRWLKTFKSGGYFYIKQGGAVNSKIFWGEPCYDEAVYFSRPADAMMFSLQCL